MEFWVISKGEKEGPMLDFDLRSRIRAGEVTKDQKVWHADLEGWTPVGELDLFANEFAVTTVTDENVKEYLTSLEAEGLGSSSAPGPPSPPPIPALPVGLHVWRRFGARWFDYLAYMAVFYSWVVVSDFDLIGQQQKMLFPFVFVLPWIFLEAASVHFWGTTPGKWLVGLQVRGASGEKLTAGASTLRAMRVMILGMGFAQPFLREICQGLAFWFATKKKVVLWDTSVGNRLERTEESAQKWVAFGVGMALFLLVIIAASCWIVFSQMTPEELAKIGADTQAEFERMIAPKGPPAE